MSKLLFVGSLALLVIAVVQTAPVSSPSSNTLEVVDTLSEVYGNRVKRQGGGCGCCGCGCCGCGGGGGGCGCCCCRPRCCCCCRRCCTCCRTCCCTRCCTCCRPCCCGCGCGCGGGGRKRRSLQNLRIKHAEKIGQESQEKSIEQVESVEKVEETKQIETVQPDVESTLTVQNSETPVGDNKEVPQSHKAYGYN